MICNSLSSVLNNLKGVTETSQYKDKPLLGEFNDILNEKEFDAFNEEYTRYVELKYKLDTKGELLFSKYETTTKFPYSSRYWRDDINTKTYAQANEELFLALDDERIKAEIKEELASDVAQPVTKVKEGVEELFESNPELANAVYEAAGVNVDLKTAFPKVETVDKFDSNKTGALFSDIDGTLQLPSNFSSLSKETQKEYLQHEYIHLQIWNKFGKRGFYNNKFSSRLFRIGKELFKKYVDNRIFDDDKLEILKTTSRNKDILKDISKSIKNTEEFFTYAFTDFDFANLLKEEGYYDEITNWYKENIGSEIFPQITSQQKQQAQQLYSQYLDTNPTTERGSKQDIEGFKEFISQNKESVKSVDQDPMFMKPLDPKKLADESKNNRAREAASILADRLALKFGLQYQNITEEQAREILNSRNKPYNNEPAFYFAGTIYTVGENVNFDTVLHEFSHPFLRAISKENPTLFNNLYNALVLTSEGAILRDHVLSNYPELTEFITDKEGNQIMNPLFMEEVLAYSLQKAAVNKVTNQVESDGFAGFIKGLMSAIKNLFKTIFGKKAKLANIDVDTNITDLADMLLGEDFEYDTEFVTEEDIVSFARNIKDMSENLLKGAKSESIQAAINEMYTTNQLILTQAKAYKTKSPVYQKMLKEALFQKGSTQLLRRIQKSLQGFQDINKPAYNIDDAIQNTLNAEELRQTELANGARSFVNTVSIANNIAQNIYNDLVAMQKNKSFNNRDAVALLYLYRNTVRTWNDMFENFDELLLEQQDNFDVTQQNDLSDLMNEVRNNLLRADNKIKEIYKDNAVDFYVEVTGYMNDFLRDELSKKLKDSLTKKLNAEEIEEIYNKIIKNQFSKEDEAAFYKKLEEKGVPVNIIKKFIDDYRFFEINIDKITDGLSGKLKDVSWFNRFFESYTSSNDPIVGGLAIFINDQKTEASQNALDKSYRLRNKLEKILPRINYNTLNTRQILDMVAFKDKVLYIDPKTKEAKEREVYSFLHEYKDYRYKLGLLEYELDKAMGTDDKDAQSKASAALAKFTRDYMWNDYLPEVYDKDKIFDKYGEVGKIAWLARKQALDAYNNENNEISNELERFQKYSTLQALWRDYKSLFSFKYEDGVTDKVDDPEKGVYDYSIAKILNEHREATKDYYEFEPTEGSLQTAFNQFLSLQEMKNLTPEEYEKEKNEWIKQNTRVAFEDSYYESRSKLIEKLKLIQDKINKSISEQFDISGAYDEIYNLMYAYKDEQGQPIPSELGIDKMKRIKELNQKIIDYKASFDKATGLSVDELNELDILIAVAKKDPAQLNNDQKIRLSQLLQKQSDAGLSLDELATLQSIYSELSDLSQRVPTEYYVNS